MLMIQTRVDLRGADVGVTQQLLHSAQVTTGLEQMTGKRVPEHVRVHGRVNASSLCTRFEPLPNGLCTQASPVSSNEQGP